VAIYLQGVGTTAILVSYAGQDLTNHVKSLTINMDYADVDVTAMNAVSVAHAPGLRDDSVEVEFFQDFAASSVHATINTYVGSSTGATLLIQSSGATVTATNPSFSMVAAPFTYQPMQGTVGDASMTTVSFMPVAGSSITVNTS